MSRNGLLSATARELEIRARHKMNSYPEDAPGGSAVRKLVRMVDFLNAGANGRDPVAIKEKMCEYVLRIKSAVAEMSDNPNQAVNGLKLLSIIHLARLSKNDGWYDMMYDKLNGFTATELSKAKYGPTVGWWVVLVREGRA